MRKMIGFIIEGDAEKIKQSILDINVLTDKFINK